MPTEQLTENQWLLNTLAEECCEVGQRVSKALRFGLHEIQPDQPANNAERIVAELADLYAMVEILNDAGVLPKIPRAGIASKKVKVASYLSYARSQGMIKDAD